MTTAIDPQQRELLSKMATPSRLARYTCKEIFGFEFDAAPHILHMEDRLLDAVFDLSRQRFVSVSMPPRHGKSVFVSVFLAAWFLGMYPEKRVILITYSQDYAVQWGRAVRDILTRYGKELFNRTVSRDASSNTDWQMERSLGGMLAVGIGGGITGRGGDLIIIDDLIKNRQEAASDATKKYHREEYDSSIRTRLEPGGTMVVVATRWAADDLPGHLRALGETDEESAEQGELPEIDEWEFIDFPALAIPPKELDPEEEDFKLWEDELGRHDGDALWPTRWTAPALRRLRNSIDPLVWAALYQQDPALASNVKFDPETWGNFPDWEGPRLKTECTKLVRVWDLAASDKKGDWTVGTLMGLHRGGGVYVFEVQRFRKHPTEVENIVRSTAAADGHGVTIMIEQERAGAGKTVLAHYQKILIGYVVKEARAETSKESRAMLYASKQGQGAVMLPEHAPWRKAWVKEHEGFPWIKHDDMVDTGAYGFNELALTYSECFYWAPGESVTPLVMMGDPDKVRQELMNRA